MQPERRDRRRRQFRLRVRFTQNRERIASQRARPAEAALPLLLLMPQATRTQVEMPIPTGVDRVLAPAPILAKGDGTRKNRRPDTGPGFGRPALFACGQPGV